MPKIKDSTWFTEMGNRSGCIGIVTTEDQITGETKFYIGTGDGSTAPGSQERDEIKIAEYGAKFDPQHIDNFINRNTDTPSKAETPKVNEEAKLYRSVINRLNAPERSNARDAAILKSAVAEAVTEALSAHEEARPPEQVFIEREPMVAGVSLGGSAVALEPPTPEVIMPLQDFMTTIECSDRVGRAGYYSDPLNQALSTISNSGGNIISIQITDQEGNGSMYQKIANIHYKAPIGSNIYI